MIWRAVAHPWCKWHAISFSCACTEEHRKCLRVFISRWHYRVTFEENRRNISVKSVQKHRGDANSSMKPHHRLPASYSAFIASTHTNTYSIHVFYEIFSPGTFAYMCVYVSEWRGHARQIIGGSLSRIDFRQGIDAARSTTCDNNI